MEKNLFKTALLATLVGATVVGSASEASACTIQKRVRLGGKDRFETAIAVSKEFEKGDKIENVLICSSNAWADAMSCAPFSAYKNAPILLTEPLRLNPKTKARLKEMRNVKNIYVLGGTGVVKDSVITELKGMGYHVERIGGKDRYETNRKMMNQIPESKYGDRPKIVNGMDFTQALTCAVDTKSFDWEAGVDNHHPVYVNPMFLIPPTATEQDIKDIAKKLQVPKAFWDKKDSYTPMLDWYNMHRIFPSDNDRKRLSHDILGEYYEDLSNSYKDKSNNHFEANSDGNCGFSDSTINLGNDSIDYKESGALLVNGENFPDSLSVSALSAKRAMPIVYANRTVEKTIGSNYAEDINVILKDTFRNVKNVYYIGGKAVMPDGRECILNGQDK